MSRKKGLSLEEKRQRMQMVFFETADVLTLKEVEKASKEKGIVEKSVKEVLEGLVADNLVRCEKIGIVNVYWQFPSQSQMAKQATLGKLEAGLDKSRAELASLQARQGKQKVGREDTPERREKLARLAELKHKKEQLSRDLSQHAQTDPGTLAAMQDDIKVAKVAANRWTDNIFIMRDWCSERFGIDPDDFLRNFDIPPTIDYIP